MRSKTSYFNGTLFKKNLSRYWPLWGLASFGGAMFPLAMLLELLHNGFQFWSPLETRQAYYTVLSYGVPVISIVYAILCAMAVYCKNGSYQQARWSADLQVCTGQQYPDAR